MEKETNNSANKEESFLEEYYREIRKKIEAGHKKHKQYQEVKAHQAQELQELKNQAQKLSDELYTKIVAEYKINTFTAAMQNNMQQYVELKELNDEIQSKKVLNVPDFVKELLQKLIKLDIRFVLYDHQGKLFTTIVNNTFTEEKFNKFNEYEQKELYDYLVANSEKQGLETKIPEGFMKFYPKHIPDIKNFAVAKLALKLHPEEYPAINEKIKKEIELNPSMLEELLKFNAEILRYLSTDEIMLIASLPTGIATIRNALKNGEDCSLIFCLPPEIFKKYKPQLFFQSGIFTKGKAIKMFKDAGIYDEVVSYFPELGKYFSTNPNQPKNKETAPVGNIDYNSNTNDDSPFIF